MTDQVEILPHIKSFLERNQTSQGIIDKLKKAGSEKNYCREAEANRHLEISIEL